MRKFSIILPTFNRPHMINRAITAVLNQSYPNWELIIVNGGKPIYLHKYHAEDKRIILIEEPDEGITDAMNKGMARATGDIFCWTNDDDEMGADALEWVESNLKGKWGYGLIRMMGPNTPPFLWGRIDAGATYEQLLSGNFVPQPAVFWTCEAYEAVGPMDKEFDLTSDYDYWIRLWKYAPPQKFQRVMADYHLHDGQITRTRTEEQITQAGLTAQKHGKQR